MGCCQSQPSQKPTVRGPFPAPLPPPMQDNVNELLNRWRHGEVNLLQRKFRLARTQPVKPSIASKILGLTGPSSNSGTATSASTSANRDGSASFGEDASTSPASGDVSTVDLDSKKLGESVVVSAPKAMVGGGEAGQVVAPLGNARGARAGLDREAFLRVFPDLQGLPVEVQRSSFCLFDSVGRGSLDFRNFCRALALSCRGSRQERLRFLFDLYSGPSQPKHYGTGADGGPRDATPASGATSPFLSEAELTGLKKQLGLSTGDADHAKFQATLSGSGSGLELSSYFEWAEVHASEEALDRALRPFYLLPSPQQEKDKVLAHLMEHTMQEDQCMFLVAAPWWSYWCNYVGMTQEEILRVPERVALGLGFGLGETHDGLDEPPKEETEGRVGKDGDGTTTSREGSDGVVAAGAAGATENGSAQRQGRATESAVPSMLARRPHEVDNSGLQGGAEWEVAPNLRLGDDYMMLPKPLWDVICDWYGGGPVFSRKVVKVSSSLQLPERVQDGGEEAGSGPVPASKTKSERLMVDLYPLALHMSLCDASGRPGGRERFVLMSHHVLVRDLLLDALDSPLQERVSRGVSLGAVPSTKEKTTSEEQEQEEEEEEEEQEQEEEGGGNVGKPEESPRHNSTLNPSEHVRLWVLEISASDLIDTPRLHTTSAPGACRPRFHFGGGQVLGGVDLHSGLERWKMVKPEEEGLTLSALGLVGGEKVMVEHKNHEGMWPRRRYIEEPDFRQFRKNDRVDAMDYQGRWFQGQVVEVAYGSSAKIMDLHSEGPVGRTKNYRLSQRREQDVQAQAQEPGRDSATQEAEPVEAGDSLEGADGRTTATAPAGASKAGSSTAARHHRASGREAGSGSGSGGKNGGREGREGKEGGTSRRRMVVRVHFDRFAPVWDECYDSKSLKLAPEGSHTAPPVSVTAALKSSDEGNGDAEAGEDSSPKSMAARGAAGVAGAPPSSSKVSGNGFPPPVGRFPGDASNGNTWSTRPPGVLRTNGTGVDGISNFGGGALNRRSSTPGKPPIAGACGLVNVGNTCYLNSAVQCLSHTPLMRAYLLSDMWAAEVNKYNPLGTQGKLVDDFASLLKSLWSQEYLCVFPSKFKRGLIKYKPQFAGNEQQDSQEFLAEMLDALHEDVNRVIDKPYVPAPEEDEAGSNRSDQELADEAWDRHVQRNRSVIVDLFQGQLKMECRCTVCNKKSVTFDPFMYLSVPIQVRNEKVVEVVLFPRIRTRYLVTPKGNGAGADDSEGNAEFGNPRQLVPVQYAVMLPRLAEISDLKRAFSELSGILVSSLVLAIIQQDQLKVMQDKELLTELRDNSVVAFEMGEVAPIRRTRRTRRSLASTAPSNEENEDGGAPVSTVSHSSAVPTTKLSAPTLPESRSTASPSEESHAREGQDQEEQEQQQQQQQQQHTASSKSAVETVGTRQKGQERAAGGGGSDDNDEDTAADCRSGGGGESTVERETQGSTEGGGGHADATGTKGPGAPEANSTSNKSLEGEGEGGAPSERGEEEEEEDAQCTDLDDDRPPTSTPDHRTPDDRCTASFPTKLRDLELGWRLDALDYQGGWFAATVIQVGTPSRPSRREGDRSSKSSSSSKGDDQKRRTEYMVKVHFDGYTAKWDESYGEQDWKDEKLQPLYSKSRPVHRIYDIPIVHRKTVRIPTAGSHGHSAPGSASARDGLGPGTRSEGDVVGRDAKEPPAGYVPAKELFGLPFLVRCASQKSTRYLWRLVVQQASRFVAESCGGSRSTRAGGKDRMAKAAEGAGSQRPDVKSAWVARAAAGLEGGIPDEKLARVLPFTVKLVLKQNPLTDVRSVELVPDKWKAVSSYLSAKSHFILALEWKDPARDYFDVHTTTFKHPSCLELENNAQSIHSGLTLEQCLDAYTREETLEEEDSWYCSSCQAHRRGVMKIDLWKMPDVLVIHLKRFQCSARWREKIRTLVLFPHSGLDMSGFVSDNSAHRNQAGGGQAGMVYDLFGVVNHMGGMTGGHYTACCRSSPCSKDGVEEVTGWGMEHPWLNFDDEFVEEMAPDKIVSESAYVLFYRRRRLTPSNVINMTI